MFIIGITGGTGSGKTTATRALKALGALVLDCDELYHRLLIDNKQLKTELETHFGGVLNGDVIDRKMLSEIVWNDPSALRKLNEITHRYISEAIGWEIDNWEAQGGKTVAIDAIAIFESGIREKCDVIIGVTAPVKMRLSRIMKRDGLTREQAEKRIKAQKPDNYFTKNCDHILQGTYDNPEEFEKTCKAFFTKLLQQRP